MTFKAARCPSCSGELMLDPSKKSGFCNHCGSEMIVEEAIDAMKLDGVASLENLLYLAQESFDDGDYEGAYNLFNRCYELDPSNSFVIYGRSISQGYTLTGENQGKAFQVVTGVNRALWNASDSDRERIQKKALEDLNNLATTYFESFKHIYESNQEMAALSGSTEVHIQTEVPFVAWTVISLYILEYASKVAPNSKIILQNIINISDIFINRKAHSRDVVTIDWSENGGFQKYFKDIAPAAVKNGFNVVYYEPSAARARAITKLNEIKETADNNNDQDIKRIDESSKINKSGFCYIATAVYGDYNSSEVRTLRSFRDETLARSRAGRLLVKMYYSIGPVLAKETKRRVFLDKFFRNMLNIFVRILRA